MSDKKEISAELLNRLRYQLTPRDTMFDAIKKKIQKSVKGIKLTKSRFTRLRNLQTEWDGYQKRIANYKERMVNESGNLPEKIKKLQQTLKEECVHPVEFLEIKELGKTSSTEIQYEIRCKICHMKKKGIEKIT